MFGIHNSCLVDYQATKVAYGTSYQTRGGKSITWQFKCVK